MGVSQRKERGIIRKKMGENSALLVLNGRLSGYREKEEREESRRSRRNERGFFKSRKVQGTRGKLGEVESLCAIWQSSWAWTYDWTKRGAREGT